MYLLLDQKNILIIIVLKWHCHQLPFLVIVNHQKTISLIQNLSCVCAAFFLLSINHVCLKYRDFVEQTVIWTTTIVDVAVHFPLLCITRNGIARSTIHAPLSNSQLVNKVLTQGVIQRFKDVNCNLSKLQTFLSNVAKIAGLDTSAQSETAIYNQGRSRGFQRSPFLFCRRENSNSPPMLLRALESH